MRLNPPFDLSHVSGDQYGHGINFINDAKAAKKLGAHVKAATIDGNLLDLNAEVPAQAAAKIKKITGLDVAGMQGKIAYDKISSELKSGKAATEVLKKSGFDGTTYKSGTREVVVAFDPKNINSTVVFCPKGRNSHRAGTACCLAKSSAKTVAADCPRCNSS